jgi:hypothetical protein
MENKTEYIGLKTPEPVRKEFEFGQSMDFLEEMQAGEEMIKNFFDSTKSSPTFGTFNTNRFENKR